MLMNMRGVRDVLLDGGTLIQFHGVEKLLDINIIMLNGHKCCCAK
ncbi:hypothetical protein Senen10_04765 [Salmonella enterica subsp. enterica]